MKTILGLPPWAAMRSAVANANVPAAPASRLRRDRCVWSDIGFLPNLAPPKRRIPAGRDDHCTFARSQLHGERLPHRHGGLVGGMSGYGTSRPREMSDLSPQNGAKRTLIRPGHHHERLSSGKATPGDATRAHWRLHAPLRGRLTAIATVVMVFEYLDWLLVRRVWDDRRRVEFLPLSIS